MTGPALPIRLLALDIDGTLIGEDLVLRPRTVAAVGAARERGVAVVLVTGRIATSALPFAQRLGLTEPIVAMQGALVREMPKAGSGRLGRLIYHHALAATVAREACAWTREWGLEPHLNHLEQMVLREDEPKAADYSNFMGRRAILVPSIEDWIRHPVTKVVAAGPGLVPEAAIEDGRSRFGDRATVTLSHPRFLEVIAPHVSKGRAIRWLARRYGVPLAQAMAVGDQFNDLEMLAEVGHGVAMGGAPQAVLDVARYVAPPVGEEGAAQMIEELILGGRPVPVGAPG